MTQVIPTTNEQENKLPSAIIKHSGISESFDLRKLEFAIISAIGTYTKDDGKLKEVLMNQVLMRIKDKETTTTKYINDVIESYLLQNKHYDILQRYMENRLEKNKSFWVFGVGWQKSQYHTIGRRTKNCARSSWRYHNNLWALFNISKRHPYRHH